MRNSHCSNGLFKVIVLIGFSLGLVIGSLLTPVFAQASEKRVACNESWAAQEKNFLEFSSPVIGFTITDFSGSGIHWYLVEEEIAPLLDFKSYFVFDKELSVFVYIDGFEIGEKFITPATEWIELEFHDESHYWSNMSSAFVELTAFAPRCTLA